MRSGGCGGRPDRHRRRHIRDRRVPSPHPAGKAVRTGSRGRRCGYPRPVTLRCRNRLSIAPAVGNQGALDEASRRSADRLRRPPAHAPWACRAPGPSPRARRQHVGLRRCVRRVGRSAGRCFRYGGRPLGERGLGVYGSQARRSRVAVARSGVACGDLARVHGCDVGHRSLRDGLCTAKQVRAGSGSRALGLRRRPRSVYEEVDPPCRPRLGRRLGTTLRTAPG